MIIDIEEYIVDTKDILYVSPIAFNRDCDFCEFRVNLKVRGNGFTIQLYLFDFAKKFNFNFNPNDKVSKETIAKLADKSIRDLKNELADMMVTNDMPTFSIKVLRYKSDAKFGPPDEIEGKTEPKTIAEITG